LIKIVAQAIPTYAMSTFKFPTDTGYSVQSIINKFWWSHRSNNRKMHWVSSYQLCKCKKDVGLVFRDLEAFNDALAASRF